ncbi:hypothetical protein PAMP_023312 [Pampus punctatissimus]
MQRPVRASPWPHLLSCSLEVTAAIKTEPRASSVKNIPSSDDPQRSKVKHCKCEWCPTEPITPTNVCFLSADPQNQQLTSTPAALIRTTATHNKHSRQLSAA